MNRVFLMCAMVVTVAVACSCGLKTRDRHRGPEPQAVETPDETDADELDIENGIDIEAGDEEAPLPMDTDFLVWDVLLDEAPQPGRISGVLTRTLTFKLNNTLDRLLTGQIVLDAPPGVTLVPGRTVGWRLRGGRSAEIPVRLCIVEGAPLGKVTFPVTIMILGETYRRRQLDLYKWLDVRLIGPFPAGATEGFSTAYPPEKKVDFDGACRWESVEFVWRRLPLRGMQADGMIDFAQILGEFRDGCAYAALRVHAEAAAGVVLAFACESPSILWLNGERVLEAKTPLDKEKLIEVTLQKGANTLLVKCCVGEKGWAYVLNVVGKQGELPSGVTFDLLLRQSVGEVAENSAAEPVVE